MNKTNTLRIINSLSEIGQCAWDKLLNLQSDPNPFLSFAFLHALHESKSACAQSGWQPYYLTLWENGTTPELIAALPLYKKFHSYGEYVFDWSWANAYQRNGLAYYPKLLSAIPFTPVTGNRLLARDSASKSTLITALQSIQKESPSTHILYLPIAEVSDLQSAGFMLRTGVQFHWFNHGYDSFTHFVSTLERKKRKNILAERRKIVDAKVHIRRLLGPHITPKDWALFYRCYRQTYTEHQATAYLNLDFFHRIGHDMPHNILLIIAERNSQPIASSLLIYTEKTLYGRYWGTLEFIPCLHFELAYYQPIEFCIEQKIACFEGGAQGEHKIARGFLPQKTWSTHWLSHPDFNLAVANFLKRETQLIEQYLHELDTHHPFRAENHAQY